MTNTDAHLEAIAAGDQDAFALWVAAAEPRIRLSLHRFSRYVDTEVVVQETLLRMWQLAPRFTPDGKPDALLRFAMVTARNLAITEARKNGRRLTAEQLSDEPEVIGPGEHSDDTLRETVKRCMRDLPRRPKRALRTRFRTSYVSDAALASELGMTINTFFQNVRRGRQALLECLQRHGITLELKS